MRGGSVVEGEVEEGGGDVEDGDVEDGGDVFRLRCLATSSAISGAPSWIFVFASSKGLRRVRQMIVEAAPDKAKRAYSLDPSLRAERVEGDFPTGPNIVS
mmetsp:Transcript_16573/g.34195  ORF Transcript_16573/g.34195 Transcript_16573/m.34195 type:complete len:100 (-) Transcript_16573:745-1044(-)